MNCKPGQLAFIYKDLGDSHLNDHIGKPVKVLSTYTGYLSIFHELLGVGCVIWKIETPLVSPCGCVMSGVPDEALKPIDGDNQGVDEMVKRVGNPRSLNLVGT